MRDAGHGGYATIYISSPVPSNGHTLQVSPSSLQWDGSVPTYTQLLDELEKPEPFTLAAWAARRQVSAQTGAHQPPHGCSQAPCTHPARDMHEHSVIQKTLYDCRPALEDPMSDPLAAPHTNTEGYVWPSAAEEKHWSPRGHAQASGGGAQGGSWQGKPGELPGALEPGGAVNGVTVKFQSSENSRQTTREVQQQKKSRQHTLSQSQGALHNRTLPIQENENAAEASTQQYMPAHAGRSSQPGMSTATLRSRRPLEEHIALSGQAQQKTGVRIEKDEHLLRASSCPLSSSKRDLYKNQQGATFVGLHESLGEGSSMRQQFVPVLKAHAGKHEKRQQSDSVTSRAVQSSGRKHSEAAELRMPKQGAASPALTSLPAADVHTSFTSMIQAQQENRRQFTPSSEEAAFDLSSQLWRRKLRRRNGVQYLWDKAVQLKGRTDKAEQLKVEK